MNIYITELLFQNNCVIVPKVGAFVANYKSAFVDMHQNTIYPPHKTIAFNKQLNKSDGLLVAYVSEQKMVSYTSAEQMVNQFGTEVLTALDKHKSYIFSGIGRLYKDASDNILFENFKQNNFLLDNYGLAPVTIEPISRLKDTVVVAETPAVIATIPEKKEKKKRRLPWALPVILPFLLVTLIGFLLIFPQSNFSKFDFASFVPNVKHLFERKADLKSPVIETPKEIVQTPIDTALQTTLNNSDSLPTTAQIIVADTIPTKKDIAQVSPPVEVKEVEKKPIILENGKAANAFICVGSFKNESNAKEMQKMIDFLGLQSVVSKSKLHQVLVATSTTRASEDLATLKEEIAPGAYIYCQNCNY